MYSQKREDALGVGEDGVRVEGGRAEPGDVVRAKDVVVMNQAVAVVTHRQFRNPRDGVVEPGAQGGARVGSLGGEVHEFQTHRRASLAAKHDEG